MTKSDKSQIIKLILEAKNEIIEGSEGYRRTQFVSRKKGPCWKETLLVGTDITDETCWGGVPPLWIVDKDGNKLFQPDWDTPSQKIYFPKKFSNLTTSYYNPDTGKKVDKPVKVTKSYSARKPVDRIKDPETGKYLRDENTGLYIMRIDPHHKQGVAYFLQDNYTDTPDYIVATDKDTGEQYLYYPIHCDDLNNYIKDPENQRKLEVIERYHKLTVLFTKCKRRGLENKPKGYPENPEVYAILAPGKMVVDKERKAEYVDPEDYSDVVPAKLRKGEKDSVSKQIKFITGRVLRNKFSQNGEYYKIFESKTIPAIEFNDKFWEYTKLMTNDEIKYRGLNYMYFPTDETYIRKIYNKVRKRKYDEVFVNTVNLDGEPVIIDLNRIDKSKINSEDGVEIRFSVDNNYTGPRKDNARLVLRLAKETDPGLGQNNYMVGNIIAFDKFRKRVTIKLVDAVGNLYGDRWKVSYEDTYFGYQSRFFKKKWTDDRIAQYDLDAFMGDDYTTKSRYEGQSPAYNVASLGFTKPNAATTLKMLWDITGTRDGGTFKWKITIKTQYGRRKAGEMGPRVTFQGYTLSDDNNIYKDGMIQHEVNVNIEPPNKQFDDLWIRADEPGESPITTQDFNNITDETLRAKYRRFTIMDDLDVYNGFIQLIDEFMDKVRQINPAEALKTVDMSRERLGTMNESKSIVERIIQEIKLRKS